MTSDEAIEAMRVEFEAHWRAMKGVGYAGFGRNKFSGDYFSEWAQDAWIAWIAAGSCAMRIARDAATKRID